MREFLSDNGVPFEDRNIRGSEAARAELAARTSKLVVPQLFWRDRHIVGFDPEALTELVEAHRGDSPVTQPPGNSLAADQGGRVAEAGETIESGLQALLARIGEELDFSDAKGTSPYRLGMHDGLRFAEDAVADLLRRHGFQGEAAERRVDA